MRRPFEALSIGVRTLTKAARWALAVLLRPSTVVVVLLVSGGAVQTYHPEHVPELDQPPEELFGDLIVYEENTSNETTDETVTTVLAGSEPRSYSLSTPTGYTDQNGSPGANNTTISALADADGDGLTDKYERNHSQADPHRKTLFVRVFDGTGDATLTQRDTDRLRTIFANMPVKNPDGSTGIDLVVLSKNRPLEDGRTIALANQTEKASLDTRSLYDEHIPPGERCRVHMVTLVDIGPNASFNGFATTPGYSVIVDDGDPGERESFARAVRLNTVVHELLHNIVGEIGDSGERHTTEGWLSGERNQRVSNHHYMTKAVAQDLTNGFYSDSRYGHVGTC